MDVNKKNISTLIDDCLNSVKNKVEEGQLLSSEKTLVFLFAMELVHKIGRNLKIDFENQCYSSLEGKSKYLDLLFYTHENFKVAIEFKLPTRSGSGNSNQTQTRESVYRDLARLNYLKADSQLSPKACYFIMATNEDSYLNKGQYTKGIEFITADKHSIDATNEICAEGLSLNGVDAMFSWLNTRNRKNKCIHTGRYVWLSPIMV